MTASTSTQAKGTCLPDLGPRGEGWVALQGVLFVAVTGSGLLGPSWSGQARVVGAIAGAALVAFGVGLIAAGSHELRQHFTAFPKPVPDGRLIEDGVFAVVRHPMYGGAVIACIGLGLLVASPLTVVSALALLAFFDLKSRREEAWLSGQFAGYAAYRERTCRLVPWVY